MRAPRARGVSLDRKRSNGWISRFGHYRYPPDSAVISEWVSQFQSEHRDIAARLLDAVEVVTRTQIDQAYRQLLASIPEWHANPSKRTGKWRFVPYSTSAGESGDIMAACLRQAMGLRGSEHKELFVQPQELVAQQLKEDDTVVLVDDFVGTGDQACESWEQLFRELVGGAGRVYLILVAASIQAQKEIADRTDLLLKAHVNLGEADNLFSSKCRHFTKEEKTIVEEYGKKFFPKYARGYGDCGFLFVLHHSCPNNTIPLLHGYRRNKWNPIFPATSPAT